jgi:uncharacterized damage-inducible protein DinB
MFLTIEHFASAWKNETAATMKLLDMLTDESLTKPEHPDIRNLGRAVWHIVTTYPEMCERFGIKIDMPTEKDPVPNNIADIKAAYQKATDTVFETVSGWSDADLQKEDDMYGEVWKRGKSLWVVLAHEIHHRGQLTILMRLAGLPVTGVYGPSREEWSKYGMETPQL